MLFKMLFTPPPTPPPQNRDSERAGASERTRTLELTHAKEEAAKMAAELARVKAQLEKEKKKGTPVPPPPPPPPPPQPPRRKQPAAVSRRRQVKNVNYVIFIFMSYH